MASDHDRALSIVYRRGLSDGHLHDAQHSKSIAMLTCFIALVYLSLELN